MPPWTLPMTAIRILTTAGKLLAAGLIIKDYGIEAAFVTIGREGK